MKTSYKDILKATTLFGGVHGLNILLNLVRTKLAASLLGPAGMGLNAIFNESRELVHEISNIGMDQSGVREISLAYGMEEGAERNSRLEDSIRLTRSWVLLLSLFGIVLMVLLAAPLSWLTFSDSSHTLDYVLLSLAVGFSSMTCGEMVVLRAMQRLRTVALISVLHVVVGILTTIPMYYFWGINGVVDALVLMTFSMVVVTCVYSFREYRPSYQFDWEFLKRGKKMLIIGLSFVVSGIVLHGSNLAIQSTLNYFGALESVGLYNVMYSIVIAYSSNIIFASLNADYYPRLSSAFYNTVERTQIVNRQIEVSVGLVFPLVVVMVFLMPVIVPLISSQEFLPIVPAAQLAVISLLFRSLYLPLGYMPLSGGDSYIFLLLETASCACIIPCVIGGYLIWGITGLGIGLLVSNLIDCVFGVVCARVKYKHDVNANILVRLLVQLCVLAAACLLAMSTDGWYYIMAAALFIAASTLFSWKYLRRIMVKG